MNLTLPTISGIAKVGQTLTASPGTWSGSPTVYFYYWRHCNAQGLACATFTGGQNFTRYVLTSADVGYTIRVNVFARNADGQTYMNSNPTAVVTVSMEPFKARYQFNQLLEPTGRVLHGAGQVITSLDMGGNYTTYVPYTDATSRPVIASE